MLLYILCFGSLFCITSSSTRSCPVSGYIFLIARGLVAVYPKLGKSCAALATECGRSYQGQDDVPRSNKNMSCLSPWPNESACTIWYIWENTTMSSSWNSRFYFAGRYYQKSACSELFHSDFPILSNTIWQSCSRQNRRSSALFCLVKSSKWPWLSCNLADVLQRCWVAALVGTQERSFFIEFWSFTLKQKTTSGFFHVFMGVFFQHHFQWVEPCQLPRWR